MHNKFSSKKIALAGIGAAISLLAVIASFYVRTMSLTFNVLAAVGILLPLTQKYYREAILAYVAVCALGGIFANIHIVSFVLVGGAYTILTVFLEDKKEKVKWFFAYPIKIAYSCFVFLVVYYLTDILFVDFGALGITLTGGLLYFVFNLVFTIAFLAYDFLLLWGCRYATPIIEKITKNLH